VVSRPLKSPTAVKVYAADNHLRRDKNTRDVWITAAAAAAAVTPIQGHYIIETATATAPPPTRARRVFRTEIVDAALFTLARNSDVVVDQKFWIEKTRNIFVTRRIVKIILDIIITSAHAYPLLLGNDYYKIIIIYDIDMQSLDINLHTQLQVNHKLIYQIIYYR